MTLRAQARKILKAEREEVKRREFRCGITKDFLLVSSIIVIASVILLVLASSVEAYFPGKGLILMIIGLALLLIIPLMGTPRLASLLNPTEGTGFLRLKLWEAAWDMVKEHPWTGVGPDNFLYYYGDYIRPGAEADRWLSHPHDLLLDFWLRLGLAGLLWIIGVVVVLLAQTRRALPSLRDDRLLYACAVGLIAGLVGALAHGLVDAFFFVIELAHWFMFALAWLTLYAKLAVRRDRMHR